MGLSRQEYWSGLPFPSPGNLPNPGIEPGSPALEADALTSEPPGKMYQKIHICIYILDPGFNQHLIYYNNVKSFSSLLSPIDSFFLITLNLLRESG